jgi:hypothetical protein
MFGVTILRNTRKRGSSSKTMRQQLELRSDSRILFLAPVLSTTDLNYDNPRPRRGLQNSRFLARSGLTVATGRRPVPYRKEGTSCENLPRPSDSRIHEHASMRQQDRMLLAEANHRFEDAVAISFKRGPWHSIFPDAANVMPFIWRTGIRSLTFLNNSATPEKPVATFLHHDELLDGHGGRARLHVSRLRSRFRARINSIAGGWFSLGNNWE